MGSRREVVGGYAQFEFKSKKEAIEAAVRFMELHKKLWPGERARPRFARCLEGLCSPAIGVLQRMDGREQVGVVVHLALWSQLKKDAKFPASR
jgi:hypothetical protein